MDRVKILGCRGSVPVSGGAFARFGGATSCVFVRLAGQPVVLDAGTGLLGLMEVLERQERSIPLLLSHGHADHLLGLPMCPALMRPGFSLELWSVSRNGLGPEEQVRALMGPPLWPVGPEKLPSPIRFHTIGEPFSLGQVRVDCLEGTHPGGVTGFRLTGGGKSVVYLPDCTLEEEMLGRAAEFAADCDVLLCDGQYSPAAWETCRSFGHSTWDMAARLGAMAGAKQTRIFHHDPSHRDEQLLAAEKELAARYPHCAFAYEGEEILL